MKSKKSPMRQCLGCRRLFPKNTLIRFVCRAGETLVLEELQKLPERGAYVCRSMYCIEYAFRGAKRVNTSLKVKLPVSVIEEFKQTVLEKEVIADEKTETANS